MEYKLYSNITFPNPAEGATETKVFITKKVFITNKSTQCKHHTP